MTTLTAKPRTDGVTESVELVQTRSAEFNWFFFTVIATFHLGSVAALFFCRWSSLAIFLAMWLLAQNVGIAISYHRQLTHRSFTTPKWVEYAMGNLRLDGAAGEPNLLGRRASLASPAHRQAGRSALAPRRQMVVAHGLDLARRASQ